jgi:hypothetical protein
MERKIGHDIASAAHVSFSEIGRIMKKLSGSTSNESDINLRNKSKLTQGANTFT